MKRYLISTPLLATILILSACGMVDIAVVEPTPDIDEISAVETGSVDEAGATVDTSPTRSIAEPTEATSETSTITPTVSITGTSAATTATVVVEDEMTAVPSRVSDQEDPPGSNGDGRDQQPAAVVCTVRLDWPTYSVKRGDTLGELAQLSGTSVDQLAKANCLSNPNRIESGQVLRLPRVITPTQIPTPTPPPTPVPEQWLTYIDDLYQATFSYPSSWEDVSDGLITKLSGDSGFVQLAALGAPYDLNEVTDDQAHHKLQPYGSQPIIESVTLTDGRSARLIFPSADHSPAVNGQALMITHYAEPILLGNYRVNYFTLAADVEHIRAIAASVQLPPWPSTIEIKQFDISVEDLATGGKRLTFTWDTAGATRGTIVSGTHERFIPWWPVEASGELTVEIQNTVFADPNMSLRVLNDVTGAETVEQLKLDWPCQYSYFFSPPPRHCPREAALVTGGAIQRFERGFMIWVPQPGTAFPSIYAFQDSGQVIHYPDTWTTGEPESDPDLVPPDGLIQPVRGFGKAWREYNDLREALGWATEPEVNYEVSYQGEIRESIPGVSYITRPDGSLLQMIDTSWHVYTPGTDSTELGGGTLQ